MRPSARTIFEMVADSVPSPEGALRTACVDEAIDRGADYATMALIRASGESGADALDDALFRRSRDAQPEPDEVDDALAAIDPDATVAGEQQDLQIDLVAVTSLSGTVLKHRLKLLAGSGWELRDVTRA